MGFSVSLKKVFDILWNMIAYLLIRSHLSPKQHILFLPQEKSLVGIMPV